MHVDLMRVSHSIFIHGLKFLFFLIEIRVKIHTGIQSVHAEGFFQRRQVLAFNGTVLAVMIYLHQLWRVFILLTNLFYRRVAGDECGVIEVCDSAVLTELDEQVVVALFNVVDD
jgi:hypothetical protein